jgi:hypothetical protein
MMIGPKHKVLQFTTIQISKEIKALKVGATRICQTQFWPKELHHWMSLNTGFHLKAYRPLQINGGDVVIAMIMPKPSQMEPRVNPKKVEEERQKRRNVKPEKLKIVKKLLKVRLY